MPFKSKAQMKACYAQNNPKWIARSGRKKRRTRVVAQEVNEEEVTVIQEITEEEVVEEATKLTEEVNEAIENKETTGKQLPENIEKLVSFMEETGGSVEDYVRLKC